MRLYGRAKARRLSLLTGAQTMLYLSLIVYRNKASYGNRECVALATYNLRRINLITMILIPFGALEVLQYLIWMLFRV